MLGGAFFRGVVTLPCFFNPSILPPTIFTFLVTPPDVYPPFLTVRQKDHGGTSYCVSSVHGPSIRNTEIYTVCTRTSPWASAPKKLIFR